MGVIPKNHIVLEAAEPGFPTNACKTMKLVERNLNILRVKKRFFRAVVAVLLDKRLSIVAVVKIAAIFGKKMSWCGGHVFKISPKNSPQGEAELLFFTSWLESQEKLRAHGGRGSNGNRGDSLLSGERCQWRRPERCSHQLHRDQCRTNVLRYDPCPELISHGIGEYITRRRSTACPTSQIFRFFSVTIRSPG